MGKGHQLHYSLKLVWNNEGVSPVVAVLRDIEWYSTQKARAKRSSIRARWISRCMQWQFVGAHRWLHSL